MPRKAIKPPDDSSLDDLGDAEDEPIPARRDTRIFQRDRDKDGNDTDDATKDAGYEEDVFV